MWCSAIFQMIYRFFSSFVFDFQHHIHTSVAYELWAYTYPCTHLRSANNKNIFYELCLCTGFTSVFSSIHGMVLFSLFHSFFYAPCRTSLDPILFPCTAHTENKNKKAEWKKNVFCQLLCFCLSPLFFFHFNFGFASF